MARSVAAPHRLRRRIAVAFVLVSGISAAALAGGSWLLVRESRLRDSVDRSVAQVRLNLSFAADNLPPDPTPRTLSAFVDSLTGGGFDTVVVHRGAIVRASVPSFASVPIPADLRRLIAAGNLAYARTAVAGGPYLVVGGPVPGRAFELYFYFPEGQLEEDLSRLGLVLLAGFVLVLAASAATGAVVARRVLNPVASASRAARALAEGLLDTRLQVHTEDEFGAWATSFNRMAEALEGKIAALEEARARERRFTADVAHELRTPLTALVGAAALLREHLEDLPPPARRPAELLVSDVARLRRLVEDLMEISRLDAGRESVRREPVSLRRAVGGVVRGGGWEDRVGVSGSDLLLDTDPRRLERILANLIGNAIEHGGGSALVRAREEGDDVVIEIADRGPGIAPEHVSRLFDRFYKADPARTGSGSGLGLAIARENALLLGGDIAVRSEVGVGTVFLLRLPGRGERTEARPGAEEARDRASVE